MREHFHEQLDQIRDQLVQMTDLVGEAMARSTRALLDADLAAASAGNFCGTHDRPSRPKF